MTLKDQMIEDVSIFLNSDEFAEQINYNGADIIGVFIRGRELQSGNTFVSDGSADRASVWVAEADVPNPQQNDTVIRKGKHWQVARELESSPGLYHLELISNESRWR